MKLHLPNVLRKALLACLTAVAFPATLSTTIGTASGIAATWFASSHHVQADETPPSYEQADADDIDDDLMLIAEDGSVSWTTTDEESTRSWDTSTSWDDDEFFVENDSVSFLGAGGIVNVGAPVTAGTLTIGDSTAGNGATFTLSAGEDAAANTVTVTGLVTVNAGYVLKLENVTFNAQAGFGDKSKLGTLIVGIGATANISGAVTNSPNTSPSSLVVQQLNVEGGTVNVTGDATWVTTSGTGPDVFSTQVTAGGHLNTKNFNSAHSVLVTGDGSEMLVEGNAWITNYGRFVINEGGSMTITGTLFGNKPSGNNSHAGALAVGSHDDAAGSNTSGKLTLGTEGVTVTHQTYAVKVYGSGSVLTVFGHLSAIGTEHVGSSNATANDTNLALEVKYGASASVSGNLTLGASDDNLEIGGTEAGNTGTLTVGGNLAGALVTVQGEGSTLTVDGTVTLSALNVNGDESEVTLSGGLTAGNATITAGSITLSGGNVSVATITLGGGEGTVKAKVSGITITSTGTWTVQKGATLEIAAPEETGAALSVQADQKLTITVTTTGEGRGGKLRLTDAVMASLLELKKEDPSKLELSLGTGLSTEEWEYALFDVGELGGWSASAAKDFLHGMLPDLGGTLKVSDDGVVYWESGRELTWYGSDDASTGGTWSDAAQNWKEGGQGSAVDFNTKDSVIFDDNGTAHADVILSGTVDPRNITISTGTYTFTGDDATTAKLSAFGKLTVERGASATFSTLGGFTVAGGQIDGALTLNSVGATNLGIITVREEGSITITDGTAVNWTGTTITGEGKVVLGLGTEGDAAQLEVMVDTNNQLFAALFAGGDGNVQRDGGHPGIGTFELANGTVLTLNNKNAIGKSLSLIQTLQVNTGASLVISDNVFDISDAGYESVGGGTIVLNGNGGATGQQGALVSNNTNRNDGNVWVKWDVELGSDATVYNTKGTFFFTGGAQLDAKGHTLTLDGGDSGKHFYFGEAKNVFHAAAGSTGTIKLVEGVDLTVHTDQPTSFAGYDMVLGSNSTLTAQSSVSLKTLSGSGNVTVQQNQTLTLAGAATGEQVYTGAITGGGTLTVGAGATFRLGDGASIGTALTLAQGADSATGGVLSVDGGTATLSSTLTGNDGTITGAGELKVTSVGGTFDGTLSIHQFTYAGGATDGVNNTFTLSGTIDSGTTLGIEGGTLALSTGDEVSITGLSVVGTTGVLTTTQSLTIGTATQVDDGSLASLTANSNLTLNGGTLVAGSDPAATANALTLGGALTVSGATMTVNGKFGISSLTGQAAYVEGKGGINVAGGGRMVITGGTSSNWHGQNGVGYIGKVNVSGGGSLVVGENEASVDFNIYTLSVSGASSSVTVNGIVRIFENTGASITVQDGAHLTITGDLVRDGKKNATGAFVVGNDAATNEDANNTVTVGGLANVSALTMTAGTANFNGGLTVTNATVVTGGRMNLGGGVVNVGGGIQAEDAVVVVTGEVTATRGQRWSIGHGGIFEMGDGGRFSVGDSGSEDFTLEIVTGGSIDGNGRVADGGKLHLSGSAVKSLMEASGLVFELATGDVELSARTTWSYQLFDMGAINGAAAASATELTDLVRELLGSEFEARALSVDESGLLTFNSAAADVEPHDLIWREGVSTWSNGGQEWTYQDGTTPFYTGDSVTFDTTGTHDVAIFGNVKPSSMTVKQGEWNFTIAGGEAFELLCDGGLTLNAGTSVAFSGDLHLTFQGGAVVGENGKLSVGSTGVKDFGEGGITLGEGAVLEVVGGSGGWGYTGTPSKNAVYGNGTIILRDVGGTYTWGNEKVTGNTYFNGLLRAFLQNDGSSAKTVKITGDSLVMTGSSNDHLIFEHIQSDLWIEEGATLNVNKGDIFTAASGENTPNKQLHLSGRGGHVHGEGEPEADSGGALVVGENMTIGWDVYTEGTGATLKVTNGKTATLTGALVFDNNTLTKDGRGTLTLNSAEVNGNGTLDIEDGTVNLGSDILTGIDVEVNTSGEGDTLMEGELHITQDASIHSLFGNGKVTYETGGTLTITGDSPEGAEFTGSVAPAGVGSVHVAEGGTLRLGDGAHIGNEVNVDGTVEIDGIVTRDKHDKAWNIGEGGHTVLHNGSTLKVDDSGVFEVGVEGTMTLGEGVKLSHAITFNIGRTGVFEMTGGGLAFVTDDGERVNQLVLNVIASDNGDGGKLRLSEVAMDALETFGAAGSMKLNPSDLDPWEDWTYHLFDTKGLADTWDTGKAEAMLRALLGAEYTSGRHQITVDVNGIVHYSTLAKLLTWTGGASTTWDNVREERDWKDAEGAEFFAEGDSVLFDSAEATPGEVTVIDTVKPVDMVVKAGEWTYTGETGALIDMVGNLYIEVGANATLSGAVGLRTGHTFVSGELHLETTGSKALGVVEIKEGGAVYLDGGDATSEAPWGTGTAMSGDGKVVLTVDADVNSNNKLFTRIFAAGDTDVQRDGTHPGIGTFEVAEGATLKLNNMRDNGKGLSLIRDLQIDAGASLVILHNMFDNTDAQYNLTGTITLNGSGADGQSGAMVLDADGGARIKWDVELAGDATVYAQQGELCFTGDSEINMKGHTLTLAGVQGSSFVFGERTSMQTFHAADGSTGAVVLAEGVNLTVNTGQSGSFIGYNLTMGNGTSLTAQSDAAFNEVSGTGRITVNDGKTLTVGGNLQLSGADGTLTLGGGGSLQIDGSGPSAVSALTMNGDASLQLTIGSEVDYKAAGVLGIGSLTNATGGTLHLTLVGVADYIEKHTNGGTIEALQLFTGGAVGDLYTLWKEQDKLHIEGIIGYTWELNQAGQILFTEISGEYTWTDSKHNNSHLLTWRNGVVGNDSGLWDGDRTYTNGTKVNIVGDTGEAATVVVSGLIEAREVNISGSSAFTFNGSNDGHLHVVDMSVGADSTFKAKVTLERKLTVQGGKKAAFTTALAVANGGEIALENGASVQLIGPNVLQADVKKSLKVSGTGTWEVDLSGENNWSYDGNGVNLEKGVRMRIKGISGKEDLWSNFANLNVLGDLQLAAGNQLIFNGSNKVSSLSAVYTNEVDNANPERLILQDPTAVFEVTGTGNSDIAHVCLEIRSGTFIQKAGTLTIGGLRSNTWVDGQVNVNNLVIQANDTWNINNVEETGGQRGYSGTVQVSGNLTMQGKEGEDFTQYLNGVTGVGGAVEVQSGTLDVGGSMTVGGELGISGGQFTWEGTELKVGTLKTGGQGTANLVGGNVTIDSGIVGDGGTVSIGGTAGVTVNGGANTYGGMVELRTGGRLTSEANGQVLRRVTAAGGTLHVGEKKNLTIEVLQDASEGTAEEPQGRGLVLELGAGAELTLRGGSFTLAAPLTWGSGASIILDTPGGASIPNILLGEGFSVGNNMTSDSQLTFSMSAAYLSALSEGAEAKNGVYTVEFLNNGRGGSVGWAPGLEAYFRVLANENPWLYLNLKLTNDGHLTWDVEQGTTWNGGATGTWSDQSSGEWVDMQDRTPNAATKDENIYLTKEGAGDGGRATLTVQGTVNPDNVFVKSGVYTLTSDGSAGGLSLEDGDSKGMLVVEEGAQLNLNLKNTSLPTVIVEGKLGLGNDHALPAETDLRLNKEGTLLYTEADTAQDVSTLVSEESTSTALHIEVGEKAGASGSVTWGQQTPDPTANSGLKLALDGGTVKNGKGNFTLHWEDAGTHAGKMEVREGSLTLESAGNSTLTGAADIAKNAEMSLKSTGGSTLTYNGVISGEGTLEVQSGMVALGGANSVGRVQLSGGTTILDNDAALGNEKTTLEFAGGDIQAGKSSKVKAGKVEVTGDSSLLKGDIEISGEVSGKGTLHLKNSAKGTLSGNIAGFEGTLDTGTSTWTLKGTSGEVKAGVSGKGTLVTDSDAEITLTGKLGMGEDDALTLRNAGNGDLVIATDIVGSGTKLVTSEKGAIVLGDTAVHLNSWSAGAASGPGTIVLANVTLANANVFDNLPEETKLIVRTAPAAEVQTYAASAGTPVVDVAGMNAGNLDDITVNAHGLLKGITGKYTKDKGLSLYFTAEDWTTYSGAAPDKSKLKYLIEGQSGFTIERGEKTQLAFDEDILTELVEDNNSFYVLALKNATWGTSGNLYDDMGKSSDQIANILAMAMDANGENRYTEDGLILTIQPQYLYLVMPGDGMGDPKVSTSPLDMFVKKATVVMKGQTLTLDWSANDPYADRAIVRNLLGLDGSQLVINNKAEKPTENRLNVIFDNTFYKDVEDDRYDDGDLRPEPGWEAVHGQDTTFKGAITGAEGVDITKTGMGTLTVGGNYTLASGTTYIEAGALELHGAENNVKAIEFTYSAPHGKDEKSEDEEERGLVLAGGHTTLETLGDAGSVEDGPGVVMRDGVVLSLTGASTLSHTDFSGGEGSGTLQLVEIQHEEAAAQIGSLVLTGDASLNGVAVQLQGENTLLDVGSGKHHVTALNGNGTLRGTNGGSLSVGSGTFSGTFSSGNAPSGKGGKLEIGDGVSFTLKNARSDTPDKAHGWDVDVQKGGNWILDLTEVATNTPPLIFGQVTLNGDLTMNLDADKGGAPVKGDLTLSDSSTFTVYATGKHEKTFSLGFSATDEMLGVLKEMQGKDKFKLRGSAFIIDEVYDITLEGEDKTITVTTQVAKENKFDRAMPGAHKNSRAGATLLWDSLTDPSCAFLDLLTNPNSDYAKLALSLYNMLENGDSAGMERPLAAVAGSSISTLGSAVSQDLHRQLSAIRNRTTTMAAEISERFPLWHAWINGETDYQKLESDSLAPGFTLNSWGGTFGVDADISSHTTIGMAVSAMYGDLKTDAADSANGDVDSAYLSAFLRTSQGAWIHTFVLSAGMSDISLDRTVNYGAGSYHTSGSTDAFSIGALYEVGYSHVLNERGTLAIQPVANIEIRHVSVSGYNESGSNAGLSVDDIEQTTFTVGAGARLQAVVAANAFNRTTVFEARLLVKADVGDRSGTATTGIVGSKTSAEVESAEVGAVGIEVGAGISVPLGSYAGSIFLDGSLEFRDQQNSANATIGYRTNF